MGGKDEIQRINDRSELGEDTIAQQLHNAAAMLGEDWIEDFVAQPLDRCLSARLVKLDQAGIADDIDGQDRRHPPLDFRPRAVSAL